MSLVEFGALLHVEQLSVQPDVDEGVGDNPPAFRRIG